MRNPYINQIFHLDASFATAITTKMTQMKLNYRIANIPQNKKSTFDPETNQAK